MQTERMTHRYILRLRLIPINSKPKQYYYHYLYNY